MSGKPESSFTLLFHEQGGSTTTGLDLVWGKGFDLHHYITARLSTEGKKSRSPSQPT